MLTNTKLDHFSELEKVVYNNKTVLQKEPLRSLHTFLGVNGRFTDSFLKARAVRIDGKNIIYVMKRSSLQKESIQLK
jgi:hypothetical protein